MNMREVQQQDCLNWPCLNERVGNSAIAEAEAISEEWPEALSGNVLIVADEDGLSVIGTTGGMFKPMEFEEAKAYAENMSIPVSAVALAADRFFPAFEDGETANNEMGPMADGTGPYQDGTGPGCSDDSSDLDDQPLDPREIIATLFGVESAKEYFGDDVMDGIDVDPVNNPETSQGEAAGETPEASQASEATTSGSTIPVQIEQKARKQGAVKCAFYYVNSWDKQPFSAHFFDKDGREVYLYQFMMAPHSDGQVIDKRVWSKEFLQELKDWKVLSPAPNEELTSTETVPESTNLPVTGQSTNEEKHQMFCNECLSKIEEARANGVSVEGLDCPDNGFDDDEFDYEGFDNSLSDEEMDLLGVSAADLESEDLGESEMDERDRITKADQKKMQLKARQEKGIIKQADKLSKGLSGGKKFTDTPAGKIKQFVSKYAGKDKASLPKPIQKLLGRIDMSIKTHGGVREKNAKLRMQMQKWQKAIDSINTSPKKEGLSTAGKNLLRTGLPFTESVLDKFYGGK